MLDKFERGEISPEEWRKFRLLRGTYGQRQDFDAQMLRVKIPQGVLEAAQFEALADVAERHSRGFGHISTRQNMQFHFVPLHDAEPAMRQLADSGLTTREACGNSVRNITVVSARGRRARRSLRRDSVFRGDDAISAPASAQFGAAAEVQDRVRRAARRKIMRRRRSTTWAGAR